MSEGVDEKLVALVDEYHEREALEAFFLEEDISGLFRDEGGNEYNLEVVVKRVSIQK